MKKLLTIAVGLGLVFTVANAASALSLPGDYAVGTVANGIVNSRHNMGSSGVHFRADNSDSLNTSGGTSEVCIFCHTPHHGSTNAPLWNKGLQNTAGYTTYGTTLANTSADGTPGAATLACLSCHDGVNTFDTIVNKPGKSGKGTNANSLNGDLDVGEDMGWIFTEDGNTQSDYMTSTRLNLGQNLTNDHPVSIAYNAVTAGSLRDTDTVISDVNMINDVLTVDTGTTSEEWTHNYWAVGGYINTGASISDLLRLQKVECSSCHDPHFKNQSWDEVAYTWAANGNKDEGAADMDGLFLRRVGGNSLSGVCRTCHNK